MTEQIDPARLFAEAMMETISEALQPRMDQLYELLGESPEAWRGVALFAAGVLGTLLGGPEKRLPLEVVMSELTAMSSMVLEHPLGKAANIKSWEDATGKSWEEAHADGTA